MVTEHPATISLKGMSAPVLQWDDLTLPGYSLAVFISDEHGFLFGDTTPEGVFVCDSKSDSWEEIRDMFDTAKAYRQREIFGVNQLQYILGQL